MISTTPACKQVITGLRIGHSPQHRDIARECARKLAHIVGASLGLVIAMPAFAQGYPEKPVRLLVGFAAGGGIDISARALAPALGGVLGQRVIVDNRPGAGSNIASEIAARAAPDGYTLLMGTVALAINRSLYAKLTFEPIKDFAPIAQTGGMSNIIVVHPVLPVKNLKEFVALATSRPGQISYATPGVGSSAHLAGEVFRRLATIDVVAVPYKGGGQAVVDVIAGHLPVFFGAVPVVMAHTKAGRLKAIAVTPGQRASAMPEVPTVAESGYPGYEVGNWYGLLAPAGTPRAVVEKLNRDIAKVLSSQSFVKRMSELGHDAATQNTPEQFGSLIRADINRWENVIRESGIRAR